MELSPHSLSRLASFPQQQQASGNETTRQAEEDIDGDARMSDDESMSTSSSLDIEDAASGLGDFQSAADSAFGQQQQQQMERDEMLQRTDSFSDAFIHHNQQQQHLHQQDGQQRRTGSLSLDVSSTQSASASRHDRMWLFTQFAPAMSKAVRSAEKSERMDESSCASDEDGDAEARHAKWRAEWAADDASPLEFPEGVQLVAARNEVTGIQVRLTSNRNFQVTTDCTNWFTARGHAPRARVHADESFIPPHLRVELFIVGYVEDENGDQTMEYFDTLGTSPAALNAREHAVYVRLRVAANVRPGAYEIPIRVFTQSPGFTDEQLSWNSCVHIRVVDVALPSPSEWKFHLDLWQHLSSIARAHGAAHWSDRHFTLIENYLAKLCEFGQKCITIVATEVPWAGQQCYLETKYPSALFEHAILEVYELSAPSDSTSEDAKPAFEINFQHFDRLLKLASKYRMDAEIEIFGLLSIWRDPANGFGGPVDNDATKSPIHHRHHHPQRRWSSSSSSSSATDREDTHTEAGSENRDQRSSLSPSTSSGSSQRLDSWRIRCFSRSTGTMRYLRRVSEIERFVTLLYEHCVSLGIVERVRVCADEPSELPLFYDQMSFLQRLAPGFKIKLAMNNLEFLSFAPPQVIDYVPLLPLVCADLDVTRRVKAQIHERGGKFCWYVCCSPSFPNQFVSSPLIEGELIGYLTFFLELDGFLRWNFCLWPSSPWENLKWRSPDWKVGDMYFVLPGKDGYPIETLRLESLRFAVQVYELLRIAQEALSNAQLEQLKAEIAQLIWRTTDFAQFCKYGSDDNGGGPGRGDLYSLDPLDYQRAKVLIIETLATAKLASSFSHGLSTPSFAEERIETPPVSPK